MSWLARNAPAIEAASALVTAFVAMAALVGIKFQLDAADKIQKAQSAREAYRSHLALAAATPEFAEPENACTILGGEKAGAYSAFVEHLLYSAEQMLDVEQGWESTFDGALQPHAAYVCVQDRRSVGPDRLDVFIARFKAQNCPTTPSCEGN